jgi:hypothetical protein
MTAPNEPGALPPELPAPPTEVAAPDQGSEPAKGQVLLALRGVGLDVPDQFVVHLDRDVEVPNISGRGKPFHTETQNVPVVVTRAPAAFPKAEAKIILDRAAASGVLVQEVDTP